MPQCRGEELRRTGSPADALLQADLVDPCGQRCCKEMMTSLQMMALTGGMILKKKGVILEQKMSCSASALWFKSLALAQYLSEWTRQWKISNVRSSARTSQPFAASRRQAFRLTDEDMLRRTSAWSSFSA